MTAPAPTAAGPGPAAVPDGHWEPAPGTAVRGTVVLLPGRGEHPGVYARFGRRLAFDGYRLLVPATAGPSPADPRHDAPSGTEPTDRQNSGSGVGHGDGSDSGPGSAYAARAHRPGASRSPAPTDRHVPVPAGVASGRAAAVFARARAEQAGGGPVVLAGSDLGALLALVLAEAVRPDGLLLGGLPGGGASDWTGDELSARTACPVHRGLLAADPAFRPGALLDPVPAALAAAAAESRPAVPVLAFHGLADPVAPVGALRELAVRLPFVDAVVVADGRHDVFNDAAHRSVAARTVLWLEQLRAGLDRPPAPPHLLTPLTPDPAAAPV
ncbi:hypothetical protein AB0K51_20180 [Kitasatospora sp. NPDC049285]|uniref:alpha/beta hydrolase n=1 Tax=Kitasatospora sp. NPDC049285 TaxID=3157096 RepID=UPI003447FDCE